ncbi:hypothetical protein QJS10_CPA02g01608 [Acorus calamus]|uniref:RRM domain-containing protein n=1 Tax=Acorus calamus TaxID=4465 RepID=A0AAV9FFQ9_ACOCL|nr:hypothetical protein QJS10_CPA02g01608 [Acorus calamus]
MEILTSKPRSFKMDRRSPQASELKASVTQKLLDFLGDYSDDVLAEYIVVLVCNGKNQVQAKEDLEAFLGDESGKFVAWLWDHLLKFFTISEAQVGTSNLKDDTATTQADDAGRKKSRRSSSRDLPDYSNRIPEISLSKNGQLEPPKLSPTLISSRTMEPSGRFERWCPDSDPSFMEKELQAPSGSQSHSKSENINCNQNMSVKYHSSKVECSLRIANGDEHHVQHEDLTPKVGGAKFNISQMHPPSQTTGASSPGQRGNVWDRLGKPCDDSTHVTREDYFVRKPVAKMEMLEYNRKELNKHSLMRSMPNDGLGRRVTEELAVNKSEREMMCNDRPGEYGKLEHDFSSFSRRKRQFGEAYPSNGVLSSNNRNIHLEQNQTSQSVQCLLPTGDTDSSKLNGFTPGFRSPHGIFPSASHVPKPAKNLLNPQSVRVYQGHLKREFTPMKILDSKSSLLPAKSEPHSDPKNGDPNHMLVKEEVMDVKLRLRQIEMEVLKLRSKQAESSNDVKPEASLAPQKSPEEDIDSRTVFVTNVHFAATKEALLSHFIKCGMVSKVVILTDSLTGQLKGKDSAEKALELSGTSFFSRTLKVVRKADAPAATPWPMQPVGKPQSWSPPQTKTKIHPQNMQYRSSHLQWRRDAPSIAENVPPSTTGA